MVLNYVQMFKIEFISNSILNKQYISNYNCSEHGDFYIQKSRINNNKIKCKKCRILEKQKNNIANTMLAIKTEGALLHDYIYDDIYYDYSIKKYIIKCKKHKEFGVTYGNHIIRKQKCKKCALELKNNSTKRNNLLKLKQNLAKLKDKHKFKIINIQNKDNIIIKCNCGVHSYSIIYYILDTLIVID